MDLALPVRVQGFTSDGGTWEDMTSTEDISRGGAAFLLKRDVELGQVLFLNLAIPKRLRQYDLNDASYRVYALVRGIRHQRDGHRVGVMFFGKFPPRGFHERPAARFLLPSDTLTGVPAGMLRSEPPPVASDPATEPPPARSETPVAGNPVASRHPPTPPPVSEAPWGQERRQHQRVNLFLNFTLQQVDEWGAVLQEELTVADNISKGGAHVMTTLDFFVGDIVLMQEAGGGFATRAEVRALGKGPDGIGRLHIKFLDRLAPDRLLLLR